MWIESLKIQSMITPKKRKENKHERQSVKVQTKKKK